MTEALTPVIEAAKAARSPEFMEHHQPSDVLFLAWRQAFLEEWEIGALSLDREAVKTAKHLAGKDADRIVFVQPLACIENYARGAKHVVRDYAYASAPYWYAEYYDHVAATLKLAKDA